MGVRNRDRDEDREVNDKKLMRQWIAEMKADSRIVTSNINNLNTELIHSISFLYIGQVRLYEKEGELKTKKQRNNMKIERVTRVNQNR